jgi:hypothetical protein
LRIIFSPLSLISALAALTSDARIAATSPCINALTLSIRLD